MSIDYSILEEFNINKEEVEAHISKSSQVNKYVVSISDNKTTKSTRTRQVKGLKELLRNLKEWYCEPCKFQSYQRTSYTRHITGVEHRAKINGNDVILCSSAKCRKPFAKLSELEEHLQYSPKCIKVSPKNKARDEYSKIMARVNKEKELYNLFMYDKDSMTDAQKEEYNEMIVNGVAGREDIKCNIGSDGFIITRKVADIEKEESAKRVKLVAEAQKKQMEQQKALSLKIHGIKSDSRFDKHTTYSSDEYEEVEISDDEKEIKEI